MGQGTRGPCEPLDTRILAVLSNLEVLPDTPEARAELSHMRRQNIEQGGAKPAITAEDFAMLVRDEPGHTSALAAVRHWVACAFHRKPTRDGRPPPRFLILQGARGRGKTVAAVWAIANEIGFYVTSGELRRARYSYQPADVEKRARAQLAKLLVLDDLGHETPHLERDPEWLFELVNERQGAGIYTIITTNERPELWLPKRYGERAWERIAHQGAVVPVEGPNLRRRMEDV